MLLPVGWVTVSRCEVTVSKYKVNKYILYNFDKEFAQVIHRDSPNFYRNKRTNSNNPRQKEL